MACALHKLVVTCAHRSVSSGQHLHNALAHVGSAFANSRDLISTRSGSASRSPGCARSSGRTRRSTLRHRGLRPRQGLIYAGLVQRRLLGCLLCLPSNVCLNLIRGQRLRRLALCPWLSGLSRRLPTKHARLGSRHVGGEPLVCAGHKTRNSARSQARFDGILQVLACCKTHACANNTRADGSIGSSIGHCAANEIGDRTARSAKEGRSPANRSAL